MTTSTCITALVAQSLVLARLDHDEPGQRVRTQVRLAPLLAEVCETARAAAAAKAMMLECRCHAEQIDGDTELLRIALRNLIDNAIRYCPPGSRVQVTAHKMPSTMELVVSDSGPGVPLDERARLADRSIACLVAAFRAAASGCRSSSASPIGTRPLSSLRTGSTAPV